MRVDKPGVGESEGVCKRTDFLTELSGYRAAFDSLRKCQFIDLDRVFVGLSNGGGTAPLVAQGRAVRDASRRHPGDAPGTNACWNWNEFGFQTRETNLRPKSICH